MKTKTYRYGKLIFKAYLKPVGQGYETGFTYQGKSIFVANFIHSSEANQWWTRMNSELRTFVSKFRVAETVSKTWYCHFFSAHLYKNYYAFVDKILVRHNRVHTLALKKNVRRYNALKRNWRREDCPRLRVA